MALGLVVVRVLDVVAKGVTVQFQFDIALLQLEIVAFADLSQFGATDVP